MKICAYVDGLNFYYRYSRKYNKKWIDVYSLINERIRPYFKTEFDLFVKIYTAVSTKKDSRARQTAYLDEILKAYPNQLEIIKGYHSKHAPYKEKQTDVNLATDLVYDGCTRKYDVGVLVSGDTDFVGALRNTRKSKHRVILIAPRNSKKTELTKMVSKDDCIIGFPKQMVLRHCLSNITGNTTNRPSSWK